MINVWRVWWPIIFANKFIDVVAFISALPVMDDIIIWVLRKNCTVTNSERNNNYQTA